MQLDSARFIELFKKYERDMPQSQTNYVTEEKTRNTESQRVSRLEGFVLIWLLYTIYGFYFTSTNKWATTCNFQQCGILTSVGSDEAV